jgi:hypothetical protein
MYFYIALLCLKFFVKVNHDLFEVFAQIGLTEMFQELLF